MKPIHYFFVGLISAIALVGGVVYAVFGRAYTYQGSQIDPPLHITNFTLTRGEGQPLTLSQLREDRSALVVFFGFTHCADVCPATMTDFRTVKTQLGKQADKVGFIFITVDPERDNPQVINTYVTNFDPAFIGLTGNQQDLERVWKVFGVYQEKQPADSNGNYEVDHTTTIYVLDSQGNIRLTYQPGADPKGIAQDLEHLIK
jgi:protein SCO1